jgi:hypothetical protein
MQLQCQQWSVGNLGFAAIPVLPGKEENGAVISKAVIADAGLISSVFNRQIMEPVAQGLHSIFSVAVGKVGVA